MKTIINTPEELGALDPDTITLQADGCIEHVHEIHNNPWYTVYFPVIVLLTGEEFRNARETLHNA